VLEELGGDDDVEGGIVEGERLFHVGPHRLDPVPGGLVEGIPVDVHADDLVAGCICARQRSGPAAEIEDSLAGAADESPERLTARSASPDESRIPAAEAVLAVEHVQGLQPVDAPV
jgi:hypothetical protein